MFVSWKISRRWFGGNININKSRRDIPDDASLFYGLRTKLFLDLNPHSLSQIEPLICSSPSVLNHGFSCALVTGGVIDTGGGKSVPSVLGMQGDVLRKTRRHSITEAAGESGEAGAEVVVWTSAEAAGAAAGVASIGLTLGGGSVGAVATGAASGVAETGSTLGGGSGGGSRHLTLLMLSVADLFSSFPRLYEASIWVYLGRGVVTFISTPL